jgi:hypothetical protein
MWTSVTAVYYHNWLQILRRKMHKNWPDLLRDGPLILHDNARAHWGRLWPTDLLSKCEWEVLSQAPYGPDMSPLDLDLFHKLTHCGPETRILVFGVFSLQLWKTADANLPFNTRVDFTHLITQYIKQKKLLVAERGF